MTITTIKEVNLAPSILAKLGNVTRIEYNPADTFPIDVKAGDVVLITAAGTVNGISFEAPDANGNREGFIVNSVSPLKITPMKFGGAGSFIELAQVTVGTGGDYADLEALMAWANTVRGDTLEITLVSNVATPAGYAFVNHTFARVFITCDTFNFGDAMTAFDCEAVGFTDKLYCPAGVVISRLVQPLYVRLEVAAVSLQLNLAGVNVGEVKTNCPVWVSGFGGLAELDAVGDISLNGVITVNALKTRSGASLSSYGQVSITTMTNQDASSSANPAISAQTGYLFINNIYGYGGGKYPSVAPSGRTLNTIEPQGLIIANP